MPHDLIKKKIVYTRPSATSYTSVAVEFPISLSEVVSLIAIHWSIESLPGSGGLGLLMAALSENPEHELNPPIGVAEFMSDPAMYGMATYIWEADHAGTDRGNSSVFAQQIIPLYGILRPKRQVAVFAHIWGPSIVGIRGEIYYEEERPAREIVDAISRRYGKYRRT